MVHHKCSECGLLLSLVEAVSSRLGIEAIHADSREFGRVVGRGDMVYGLFVFEAHHVVEEVVPTSLLAGAMWRGIIPVEVVANIIYRWCRDKGLRRVLLLAHGSARYLRSQARRVEMIAGRLRSMGIEAYNGLGSRRMPRVPRIPLAFFRGVVWRKLCGSASLCMPPLLEEGFDDILSWILMDARRLLDQLYSWPSSRLPRDHA